MSNFKKLVSDLEERDFYQVIPKDVFDEKVKDTHDFYERRNVFFGIPKPSKKPQNCYCRIQNENLRMFFSAATSEKGLLLPNKILSELRKLQKTFTEWEFHLEGVQDIHLFCFENGMTTLYKTENKNIGTMKHLKKGDPTSKDVLFSVEFDGEYGFTFKLYSFSQDKRGKCGGHSSFTMNFPWDTIPEAAIQEFKEELSKTVTKLGANLLDMYLLK